MTMMITTQTMDEIIRSASNMYTFHTFKDNLVWGSTSPEEPKIVALKVKVE